MIGSQTIAGGDGRGWMRRAAVLLLVAAGVTAVGGCRTTEGLGKDVKTLGKNVEDSAARNQ